MRFSVIITDTDMPFCPLYLTRVQSRKYRGKAFLTGFRMQEIGSIAAVCVATQDSKSLSTELLLWDEAFKHPRIPP